MVDVITLGICFLAKRAIFGAIAGAIIGAIPFAITKSITIYGISISTVTILSVIIGFEINIC